LWLLVEAAVVAVVNFPQDKTIRVLLAMQEPRKAETDKAKAVAMVLEVAAVAVAKMAVRAD
jgi:hypothetical protein